MTITTAPASAALSCRKRAQKIWRGLRPSTAAEIVSGWTSAAPATTLTPASALARDTPSERKHSVHSRTRLGTSRAHAGAPPYPPRTASLQGVRAGHDLEDLLGDLRLAGAVHRQRVRADELRCVSEALRMAVMRAPCSEAVDSSSAR